MSLQKFKLEIITPEKEYFCDFVEQIICPTQNGELGILKGHRTMFAALCEGILKIQNQNGWEQFYISDGFIEVRPDESVVFVKYCDISQDIKSAIEKRRETVLEEKKRYEQSVLLHRHSKISLTRHIEAIKSKGKSKNM